MRGNGAGLSETALAGSSEVEGESTAESSMLIVGARGLCWVCLGGPVPAPSGLGEDMAGLWPYTLLLLLPTIPQPASQSCLGMSSVGSVVPRGVMKAYLDKQFKRQRACTTTIRFVIGTISNDW